MISIISLIFKSPKYADFVYEGLKKHMPELENGEAEFFFFVNNGTNEIKKHLKEKNYPHYIFNTPPQKIYPLNRPQIYESWNKSVEYAKGDIICFVNSDMWFSKDWLKNLVKNLDKNKIITSRLIESGKIWSATYITDPTNLNKYFQAYTITKDFGRTPETFDRDGFEKFAESIKEDKLMPKGTFMPLVIHKSNFIRSGGYDTQIQERTGRSGDFHFFYWILEDMGIKHFTACDSICYHVQEGEVDSND